MNICLVAGARPNFMKIAPIVRAIQARKDEGLRATIVHTGQHYDENMSDTFFRELGIPAPDYHLEAGSGSHAVQTAAIMVAFENVCEQDRPDMVVVVGDVNSTLACSIVSKKLQIAVSHVEAGLRSFDLSMPEEINRMVTDAISDLFFVTEQSGMDNLLREGKPKERIHFVGHVMIDNLLYQLGKLDAATCERFPASSLKKRLGAYLFLTLHRPSNVDDPEVFSQIADALNTISRTYPIVFPIHPRTRKCMEKFGIHFDEPIVLLEPLGFMESLYLWKDAAAVLTDSGGLQEETTALGIPCITLRNNTERPITIEMGTNVLAGNSKEGILRALEKQLGRSGSGEPKRPPLWDGHAAERIVRILARDV
ncbi:non-hydrolyzing UDP-N-acetylglucosamine 2-epimerase [Desulfatirhabdium butyrativorans]|uniref:non-hydrolyzing UDP-N-acetylglucosamine 2-epimerase n=1 Tax=Desulfatirhabdium butyrativorans TaxID=340467 RepID=UPI0003FC0B4E|nr:UDP-N-acetylglucosamine 2-epimerase (non-hydrolyzing) [Desulfatirhabdium butyrativorans]